MWERFPENFHLWRIEKLTIYRQSANPNATNSELDAKIIIKHPQLNNDQFGELIQQFVELQVDNMDTKTMAEWITDELIYQYLLLEGA